MPSLTREDIKQAIATVESSRQTHVDWAQFYAEHPDAEGKPEYHHAGGKTHHEECVRSYDHVLKVLHEVAIP